MRRDPSGEKVHQPGSFGDLLRKAETDVASWEGASRAFKEMAEAAQIGVLVQELAAAVQDKTLGKPDFDSLLRRLRNIADTPAANKDLWKADLEKWKHSANALLGEKPTV